MKKLGVAKQTFMVKCDTFGCQNRATHMIGNLQARHTCNNYCNECLETIREELTKGVVPANVTSKEVEIAKDIFKALAVDGRVSKKDLVEIANKHEIEANEDMKVTEILRALAVEEVKEND